MAKQDISRNDKIALYKKLVATNSKAMCKGATIPYTSLNGNMYSYFSKDGFVGIGFLS